MKWEQGTKRGKVYVPKEPEAPVKSGYDSDDEEEAKKKEVVEDPGVLDDEYTQALQIATATDIQDIADILGVTFQEHCSATALKVTTITMALQYTAGVSTRGSKQYKHR